MSRRHRARSFAAALVGVFLLGGRTLVAGVPGAASPAAKASGAGYHPVLDPANFVAVVDNPYFPLPVGRTLVYQGVKDGQTQIDTVTVTPLKKVILGITTTAFLARGKTDTTGSWQAGVGGAEPGLIMEASPKVPDAYRQELLAGVAEDTAWIVQVGGTIQVPYGKLRNVLTSLEATQVEPGSYDRKVYAPGIGIVLEEALTGDPETAQLVSITGP